MGPSYAAESKRKYFSKEEGQRTPSVFRTAGGSLLIRVVVSSAIRGCFLLLLLLDWNFFEEEREEVLPFSWKHAFLDLHRKKKKKLFFFWKSIIIYFFSSRNTGKGFDVRVCLWKQMWCHWIVQPVFLYCYNITKAWSILIAQLKLRMAMWKLSILLLPKKSIDLIFIKSNQ